MGNDDIILKAVLNTMNAVEDKKAKKAKKVKEGVKEEKPKRKLSKKERQILEVAQNTVLPDHYTTVWTKEDLEDLAEFLRKNEIIAIDTETLGVNVWKDDIVGISFYAPHRGFYIPIQHIEDVGDNIPMVITPPEAEPKPMRLGADYVKCLPRELIRNTLKPILEDKGKKWLLHNAKFDVHVLRNWMGIYLTPYFDTMIAQALLDENQSKALKDLAVKYLKVPADKYSTLFGKTTFNKIPILLNEETRTGNIATYYAAKDTELTYRLWEFQSKHLERATLKDIKYLMYNVEMPFLMVVVDAEARGVNFDVKYMVNEVAPNLHAEVEELRQKIWRYTGEINLNSPRQKADALYNKLKLPVINKDKPMSTDKKTLKKLKKEHPVIPLLLEYSEKVKLATAFADKLPQLAIDGKIHTNFNQVGARTGRMSSKDPNLQQMPARIGGLIRSAFYADKGRLLASIDFSQQELRVLAHVSQDPVLLDIYKSGKDVHSMTANGMWNAKHPEDQVSYEDFEYRRGIYSLFQDKDGNWVEERFSDDYLNKLLEEGKIRSKDNARHDAEMGYKYDKFRKDAKTVNFGIIYGMSDMGLADQLEITEKEAALYIEGYFAKYPGVRKWMAYQTNFIKQYGYTQTMLGRKRRVYEDIQSGQKWRISRGIRMGINSIIQGSSADMVKVASIKLQPLLKKLDAYIVMWIHDEILFDVPADIGMDNLKRIADVMCNALPLDCGLKSDIEVGERWSQKMSEEEIETMKMTQYESDEDDGEDNEERLYV